MNSNAVLRLMVDALVEAGAWSSPEEGRAFVRARLAEYEAAGRLQDSSACPLAQPGRREALDGLAGAFLQASEHFELLAEFPPASMASAPGRDRPPRLTARGSGHGTCRG